MDRRKRIEEAAPLFTAVAAGPQLRRILNIMALPLVASGKLYGSWYAQKTEQQKMPGGPDRRHRGRKPERSRTKRAF